MTQHTVFIVGHVGRRQRDRGARDRRRRAGGAWTLASTQPRLLGFVLTLLVAAMSGAVILQQIF